MEDNSDKDDAALRSRFQTFFNTCRLRRFFNIRWPEKIRNEELWERAGQEPVAKQRKTVGLDTPSGSQHRVQHLSDTPSPDMEPAGI
nr:hypothetical protein BaRGS_034950 [Batillaria attramentaria]